MAPKKGGRREGVPGHKLGWDRKREAVAGERSPCRMTRKFRGLRNVDALFPMLLPQVRNSLTPLMDLLVQDMDPLLARDFADKRPTLLLAGY